MVTSNKTSKLAGGACVVGTWRFVVVVCMYVYVKIRRHQSGCGLWASLRDGALRVRGHSCWWVCVYRVYRVCVYYTVLVLIMCVSVAGLYY